jgi:hypothetical protein
VTKDRPNVRP